MSRCYLHGIVWEYVGGMMYPWNVSGKYGKHINGFDKDHFLWRSYSSYNVNGYTQ